jgi:hypothetical protein
VISFFPKCFGHFWEKNEENFGEMCFSCVNSTNFSISGKQFANFLMKKIWREDPNMKDIHGKFLPNSLDFKS